MQIFFLLYLIIDVKAEQKKIWIPIPYQMSETSFSSTMYLSLELNEYNKISLEKFKPNHKSEVTLTKLITHVQKNNLDAFKSLSQIDDKMLMTSWAFYSVVLKKLKDKKIVYFVEFENVRLYFLSYDFDKSLVVFALKKVNENWLNTPSILEIPIVETIVTTVVWMYDSKQTPVYDQNKIKFTQELIFDSIVDANKADKPVKIRFNGFKTNFKADSIVNDPSLSKLGYYKTLKFYQEAFLKLKAKDLRGWFDNFDMKDETNKENFIGLIEDDENIYRDIKLSNDEIKYLIDLGKVNIVFFRKQNKQIKNNFSSVVKEGKYYFVNEFNLDHLTNLFSTKEFLEILNKE